MDLCGLGKAQATSVTGKGFNIGPIWVYIYVMDACWMMLNVTCTTFCNWMKCCKCVSTCSPPECHWKITRFPSCSGARPLWIGLFQQWHNWVVDKIQGTSVTWQAITVKILYLCSAQKQIWCGTACWRKHTDSTICCRCFSSQYLLSPPRSKCSNLHMFFSLDLTVCWITQKLLAIG